MMNARQHTAFSFSIATEERKGLEFLLNYYQPYTRAYNSILAEIDQPDTEPEPRDAPLKNAQKMIPRKDHGLFYVCNEQGCNNLCPAELMKCRTHREYNEPVLKTDDPEEFYINPKFKNV